MVQTNIPDFYSIYDLVVSCHLLVNDGQCVLIDTGLTPLARYSLKRRIRSLGLAPSSLKAIFLTHGHLDHTGNIAWIQKWSGAQIYIHREDQMHLEGRHPYHGASRICGWLESIGRAIFRYSAPKILNYFQDGEKLPFGCGLQVMHLPGHTDGHCGFFHIESNLLFSGDLFACYLVSTHAPPFFLNTSAGKLASSFRKVAKSNPRFIVCNHYEFTDPCYMRRKFQQLYERRFAGEKLANTMPINRK